MSPIKESRREGSGSSLELRCSPEPERSITSSPVTPVDNESNMAALITWDDEEGDLKQTTPIRNQQQQLQQQQQQHQKSNGAIKTINGGNKPKPHQSSRIR